MVTVWLGTSHGTFELAMHQINDYGLRSFQMGLPRLQACFIIIFTVRFNYWHKWLYLYAVQIFMEAVKNYVEQFLRILLLKIRKLFLKLGKNTFKVLRYNNRFVSQP